MGPALADPDVMREQIDKAISKMFESFPVPPSGRVDDR